MQASFSGYGVLACTSENIHDMTERHTQNQNELSMNSVFTENTQVSINEWPGSGRSWLL